MMLTLRPLLALFTRALREDLRSKFPPVLRAVMLLLLISLLWMTQQFSSFTTMQAQGLYLLGYLTGLNFIGVTLLGLATFGSAITEEKEDETLGLLRMTRLNPLAILLGKSTARLVNGALLLAVQVPFALLCVTLGGVRAAQIWEVYAILGAYLFLLCNLGLLFSVVCRTTASAILFSLLTGLMIFLVAPAIWASQFALGGGRHNPLGLVTGFLMQVNPVFHLASAVAGRSVMPFRIESIAFSLICGAGCFLAAWGGFERFCGSDRQPLIGRGKAAGKGRRTPRSWARAVLWKDFYLAVGGFRKIGLRVVIYLVLVIGTVWWRGHVDTSIPEDGLLIRFLEAARFCGAIGFTLEFALAASVVFGKERREQTLGTLAVLPWPVGRLIWQKLGGYALGLWPAGLLWLGSASWLTLESRFLAGFHAEGTWSWAMLSYAVLQFLFFGALIVYLSLRLRRGALVAGVLGYLVWNFLFVFFISRLWLGSWYRHDPGWRLGAMYWSVSGFFVILLAVLAFAIPRRLAVCAAED